MPPFTSQLEPLQFPIIGNSIVIGIFSVLHIIFAGASVGFMLMAPVFEAMGRRVPPYTEFAHTVTRFTVIVFSTSSVLAVIMVELMIGLFPVTTMWIWNQFRVPIFLAIAAFFLQLFALYPYYHYWEAVRRRSIRLHIALGAVAAGFVLVWVVVLDGMGSYMLTPRDESGWSHVLNMTWVPLVLHRLGGDLVMAGYGLAAYAAWRLWKTRPSDRVGDPSYYNLLLKTGMAIGLGALILQPFTGLLYAHFIQSASPEVYDALRHGPYQPLLYVQFTLLGLLFIASHFLLKAARPGRSGAPWSDVAVVILAGLMVISVGHAAIQRLFLYLLTAMTAWVAYCAWPRWFEAWPRRQESIPYRLAMALGVFSVLMYVTMGTIRETARRPDTVRGMISLHDQIRPPLLDRSPFVSGASTPSGQERQR